MIKVYCLDLVLIYKGLDGINDYVINEEASFNNNNYLRGDDCLTLISNNTGIYL